MRPRHLAFLLQWPAAVAAAFTLTVGLSVTGPASASAAASTRPTPTSSTAPKPAPSAAVSGSSSKTRARHGARCMVTRSGHLSNCAKPVSRSKLPAGATDKATMGQGVGNIADLVDTRTWTSGGGNTFPGADVPFGMVQWSPDTYPDRNAGGGYGYGDTELMGYSLTHLSGPGCGAGGDIPILPMTGALPSGNPNNDMTSFTNTGEVAQAGYYSAESNMPNTITSEFTATPHTSMGRFTFPKTTAADFMLELQNSQTDDTADSAQIVGNNEVTGSVTTGDFCGEGVNDGQSSNTPSTSTWCSASRSPPRR